MNKLNFDIGDIIVKTNLRKELFGQSKFACKSRDGQRRFPERESIPDKANIRPIFFHDTDKIIHSLSYARYIDKTQVFYLLENDHITHRVLHVQFVSKIGRVIGRALQLNEDLIEAISLGHDIGHTPYGHNGEKYLNTLCEESGIGYFVHNAQSVRFLSEIENKGEGLNLTLQVLDGILCHNGEILEREYYPHYNKNWEDHLTEYESCFNIKGFDQKISACTLEGCVMRISDVIAYIGRDIEDAITVGLINRKDIPTDVKNTLGDRNDKIINSLVIDIINNSYGKDHLEFSKEVFEAFKILKDFNYEKIYNNPKKQAQDDKIENMFNTLFYRYLTALNNDDEEFFIVNWIKNKVGKDYLSKTPKERIVIDYISGMTDDFINKEYSNLVIPKSFGYKFK